MALPFVDSSFDAAVMALVLVFLQTRQRASAKWFESLSQEVPS